MKNLNELLKEKIKNKKAAVLGFGREGKSTLKKLIEAGTYTSLTVIDKRDVSADVPKGVLVKCGDDYLEELDDFDIIFKTPGVVLPKDVSEYLAEISSETEIFMQCFGRQVIGITGTKGKSTTSSLLYHVLKKAGRNVLFAGNIGIPVFEIADSISEDTDIVIELSCHQLEFLKTSPHRAVLLNIFEDHLDHYGTREKYGKAKLNIFSHQSEEDFLYTTKETADEWGLGYSKTFFIKKDILPFENFESIGANLKGEHNLLNAAFVYKIASELGVNDDIFTNAVASFETLPHRLEYAGTFNGVDFYDDSISTTVKSAISAVNSIKNASVLLIGGMERNIRYEELVEFVALSNLKAVICMYESGNRFYNMYEEFKQTQNSPKAYLVKDLTEAVTLSKKIASQKEAVLLSPASASYGYFKNFEERGDVFKELVKNTVQ